VGRRNGPGSAPVPGPETQNRRWGENSGGGTPTVNGSTLSGNSASNAGGGIANEGIADVTNGSTLSGNSANFGGGIDNFGTLTVSGCTLSSNAAYDGGASATPARRRSAAAPWPATPPPSVAP
jgi:hypothetical protein